MNREEILSKARQDGLLGNDEGIKNMRNKGRYLGRLFFTGVYCVITIFGLLTDSSVWEVQALFLAFLAGELFSEWRFSRKKVYLALTVVSILTVLLMLVAIVSEMFGIVI